MSSHEKGMVAKERDHFADADKMIGAGVRFERTRRITGYLSPVYKWNNAKRAELKDRIAHD